MKSRILSVTSASTAPTSAPPTAPMRIAGRNAQPKFTVSTAAK